MYCSHTYHCLNHLHSLLSYLDDCPGDVHHPLPGYLLQNIVNGDESPSAAHTSTVQDKQKVKHNIRTALRRLDSASSFAISNFVLCVRHMMRMCTQADTTSCEHLYRYRYGRYDS